jgi:hypothetical protein
VKLEREVLVQHECYRVVWRYAHQVRHKSTVERAVALCFNLFKNLLQSVVTCLVKMRRFVLAYVLLS